MATEKAALTEANAKVELLKNNAKKLQTLSQKIQGSLDRQNQSWQVIQDVMDETMKNGQPGNGSSKESDRHGDTGIQR